MTPAESSTKFNVLGIGSSLRELSYSTSGLKLLLDKAKSKMAETRLIDLRQTNLPMLYSTKEDTEEMVRVCR
jgi:NAD(P)H-dependent FMN reductase